jgi:hypothetical protein
VVASGGASATAARELTVLLDRVEIGGFGDSYASGPDSAAEREWIVLLSLLITMRVPR